MKRSADNRATSLLSDERSQMVVLRAAVGYFFYRAMHFSAKRGIAIECRLSVRLSVSNVGGSGSHRLKILETNFADILA